MSLEDGATPESMDDTILANYRELMSAVPEDERPESEAAAQAEPEAKADPEVKAEAKPETKERARDESGRFAKKADEPAEPVADVEQPKRRPAWQKAALEKFDGLPPEVQQAALAREDAIHKGIEQYREAAGMAAQVRQAVGHREQALVAQYGSVPQAINQLLNLSDFASRDPVGFIRQLAQTRGIDLAQIAGVPQEQTEQTQQPDITGHPLVRQLMQEVNALKQYNQSAQQQNEQASLNNIQQALAKFEAEHDKDGFMQDWIEGPYGRQPGPFRQMMGSLLGMGDPEMDLQKAYEAAVRANPRTHQIWLARQQAAWKAEQEKAQAVQQAKKAASVNVRQRGQLPTVGPASGSMDTTILETYRNLMSS